MSAPQPAPDTPAHDVRPPFPRPTAPHPAAAEADTDTAAPQPPSHPWFVVSLLMLAQVMSFADRQVLNLMVGPIRHDLGISDTQISLLMGFSFAIFYTICGIPLAWFSDRGNRRLLLAAGAAIWSAATASCGLAQHFAQLLLGRVGVGVGEATLSPTAISLITDYFPRERRGIAQSIYATGTYIGAGVAFLLGGLVINYVGRHGVTTLPLLGAVRPWQLVFLILGAAGVLLALLLLLIREPPRAAVPMHHDIAGLWPLLRGHRRTFLCHHLGFAMTALAAYGSAAWLPSYFIRVMHWTPVKVGVVYGGCLALFGTLGILGGGFTADRLGARGHTDATLRVGLAACLLAIPCIATLLLTTQLTIQVPLLAAAVFLFSAPLGAAVAGLQEIVPSTVRAQASAVYLFTVNLIGLGVGPTAVALVTDRVFHDDMAVGESLQIVCAASLAAAALLLWLGLAPYRRSYAQRRAQEQAESGASSPAARAYGERP